MAGNSFGNVFRITTFGESHGQAIGVILDGCPAGIPIDISEVQAQLDRRRPGQNDLVTQRQEKDEVHILSGIFEGKTTGTPIGMILYNIDMRSTDYDNLKNLFRPGHADYTYFKKYGIRDHRGSGRASARETAARVAAGAIALKLLAYYNIKITGYLISIGTIKAVEREISIIEQNKVRCPDVNAAKKMETYIQELKDAGDSAGGVIEVIAKGVPPGLGEPVFDKLSADLAKAMMSINAVKGVEIGDGFACTELKGSENNDSMLSDGFATNHAGGILGGISTGADIVVRVAVKPASSIAKTQNTLDIQGNRVEFSITGRHDPCVAIRAVPVVEAMMAITLADHLLRNRLSRLSDM
ncbi:MAG: chorismate synthase [Candidatus Auribacterota bacterium]|jgi:chorismate synthase|nr:chorismate synthase [Candidatus Auribacterota bacterium]